MSKHYILVDHEPVEVPSIVEWALEFERRSRFADAGNDPWLVGLTGFVDDAYISTVFLGLDHNWVPNGVPHLFETMVFPEETVYDRCATWREAVGMHMAAVAEASFEHGAPISEQLVEVTLE